MSNLLGPLIRARRVFLKMSREVLAAKAGYSATTVQKAEKGENVDPQTLTDLAQAVGLNASKEQR